MSPTAAVRTATRPSQNPNHIKKLDWNSSVAHSLIPDEPITDEPLHFKFLAKENVMKAKFPMLSLAVLLFPILSQAQSPAGATQAFGGNGQSFGVEGKFRYYLNETYLNPSVFTAPAFRAGIRMANPPGKGA